MPTRSSKRPTDANQLAAAIVALATGERDEYADENQADGQPQKNPAAVALGKLGGKKGGKARAEKLSPERRSEIARDAATTRWNKG